MAKEKVYSYMVSESECSLYRQLRRLEDDSAYPLIYKKLIPELYVQRWAKQTTPLIERQSWSTATDTEPGLSQHRDI